MNTSAPTAAPTPFLVCLEKRNVLLTLFSSFSKIRAMYNFLSGIQKLASLRPCQEYGEYYFQTIQFYPISVLALASFHHQRSVGYRYVFTFQQNVKMGQIHHSLHGSRRCGGHFFSDGDARKPLNYRKLCSDSLLKYLVLSDNRAVYNHWFYQVW